MFTTLSTTRSCRPKTSLMSAVYGIGRELSHAGRIHQAIGYSHSVARFLQRAFQHQIDPETLAACSTFVIPLREPRGGNNLERITAGELGKLDRRVSAIRAERLGMGSSR